MKKRICEIKGYEDVRDCYYVTNEGKILTYAKNPIFKIEEGHELRQLEKTGGYLYVCLMCNNNTKKYCRVQVVVARAFVENEKNKSQVNHKDQNKHNNNANNLEWMTATENSRYTNSKRMFCYDLKGNLIKVYENAIEAKEDGFTSHAFNVARGIEKTHRNHYFSYTELTKNEVLQRLSKPYPRNGKKGVE